MHYSITVTEYFTIYVHWWTVDYCNNICHHICLFNNVYFPPKIVYYQVFSYTLHFKFDLNKSGNVDRYPKRQHQNLFCLAKHAFFRYLINWFITFKRKSLFSLKRYYGLHSFIIFMSTFAQYSLLTLPVNYTLSLFRLLYWPVSYEEHHTLNELFQNQLV